MKVTAVVDTGFNGSLTLPPALIAKLGLKWRSYEYAELSNGAIERFRVYSGTVVWDGKSREILVDAADTSPLIGMQLLLRHELRIQSIVGGKVSIEPLP